MPYGPEFQALAKKVNNWGRWGPDDERGTVNFITDEVAAAAAGSIRSGERISCALPLNLDGPQLGFIPGRVNPLRTMVAIDEAMTGDRTLFCTSDDVVTMGLQAATHWDSLAHCTYDDRLYNDRQSSSIDVWGAHECGIDKIGHLVGRGVLLDVAAAKGLERLPESTPVGPDDLDEAAAFGNIEMRSGDIVLIRTGQMQVLLAGDKMGYVMNTPGLAMAAPEWFHRHEVAAAATDTLTYDVYPFEDEAQPVPVHCLCLVEMGMTQGQNFNLEALSAACAADGNYDFFLEASPQPFTNGLGSPVNPVAIK